MPLRGVVLVISSETQSLSTCLERGGLRYTNVLTIMLFKWISNLPLYRLQQVGNPLLLVNKHQQYSVLDGTATILLSIIIATPVN